MILSEPIRIFPPPTSDSNGKIVNPPPIDFNVLDVTYHINPTVKAVTVTINQIPTGFALLHGEAYDGAGNFDIAFLENRLRQELGDNPAQKLRALFPRTLEEDPDGPGTILSGMISSIGIKSTANCSCRRHALEMNANGPDWCDANINTILGWLKEESGKRNLPFVEAIAKLMVQRAIKTSRRLLSKKQTTNA